MKQHLSTIRRFVTWEGGAMLSLATFLLVAAGLTLVEIIGFLVVLVMFATSGVVITNAVFRSTVDDSLKILLGLPLGVVLAVASQQLIVAMTGFTVGWTIPTMVTLPIIFGRRSRLRVVQSPNLEDFVVAAVVASLALADLNWAFVLGGGCALMLLALRRRVLLMCVVVSAFVVRFVIDDKWFLVSNDRLFEEAYSRSIYHFGFWTWYGASDTWVPYHWFAHAVGGILQSQMGERSFVAVGAGTATLSSLVLAGGVVGVARWAKLTDRRSICIASVTPLLGAYLLGESNSADLSVSLAVWLIALVLHLYVGEETWWHHVLIWLGVTGVVLAKVSTGLVLVVSLVGMFLMLSLTGTRRMRSLRYAGMSFLALLVTVVFNYGLFVSQDDSRGSIEFAAGGALSLGSIPTVVKIAISVVVFVIALLLPIILSLNSIKRNHELLSVAVLAATLVGVGWFARLFVRTYNNESFLEAALLCAAPLLLVLTIDLPFHVMRLVGVVLIGFGAALGLTQEVYLHTSLTGVRGGLVRLMGNGLFSFSIVAAPLLVVWIFRRNRMRDRDFRQKVIAVAMVVLMSTWLGSDAYRLSRQIRDGSVWAQTNFGMPDSYFFGNADELRAADWVRRNTPLEDVIATNHLCPLGVDCLLAGESPIAAWSQRRTYIEAERFIVGRRVDEVPIGSDEVLGHPEWINKRKELSIEFGGDQRSSIQSTLVSEGARWFWLDLSVQGARLTRPDLVAFSSGAIAILRLSAYAS